ncbi:MAG: hypothetical protein RIQ93_2496, partial [Verrucomicrobiota bacterium]
MITTFRPVRLLALFVTTFAPLLLSAADVRLYVQYALGQKGAAQAALRQAGATTIHQFDNLNAVAASMPEQARVALERNPSIVLVESDPVRGFLAEDVPYGINMVQATNLATNTAISAVPAAKGIKVGVVDSGVFKNHEDLAAVSITGEPDFGATDQRTWYRDYLSHGTHVVGTIAAAKNDLGVVGVSPGTVSIHMVKVFGDTGNWIYSSDLLTACRAAAGKGCKVISMSLGGATSSTTEQAGMDDLYNQGVLLIAAAGNSGTTAYSYPASYSSVVSVAAIDSSKNVASFSQNNNQVELAAPGVGVRSTVSYVESNSVNVGTNPTVSANYIEFSARRTASGALVYGGLGTSTNSAWTGKVVLFDRGTNSFYEKVRNAQLSKAVACIIANNEPGNFLGTLGSGKSSTIPAVAISQEDGALLKVWTGQSTTVSAILQQNANAYDFFDGTSMATPHVSGVAAVIWSA